VLEKETTLGAARIDIGPQTWMGEIIRALKLDQLTPSTEGKTWRKRGSKSFSFVDPWETGGKGRGNWGVGNVEKKMGSVFSGNSPKRSSNPFGRGVEKS